MRRNKPRRAGFTILEMFISTLLLSAVMVLAAVLFRTISLQRQASSRHLIMVEAAQNMMDELTLLPFADLNQESTDKIMQQHKEFAIKQGFQTKWSLEQVANPSGKRIVISLQRLRHPHESKTVRLVSWVYATRDKDS